MKWLSATSSPAGPLDRLRRPLPLALTRSTTTTSPGADRVAGRDLDRLHDAGLLGVDGVLHLHRLEDDDGVAGLDRLADLDVHLDDRALHRHDDLARAAAEDAGVVLTTGLERGALGRVGSSSSASGTHSATVTRRPLTSAVTSLRTRPSPIETTAGGA